MCQDEILQTGGTCKGMPDAPQRSGGPRLPGGELLRKRVFFISLGCAKNLVDTEHMLGLLCSEGFELTGEIDNAGVVVINTCGFIREAVEETIETILQAAHRKKHGGPETLIVTGCFVQRYGYRLAGEIPEVDAWVGTGEIRRIAQVVAHCKQGKPGSFFIGRPLYLPDHAVPRIRATPPFTAYLRIAEGCSRTCSYCMIPKLRGPLRSRRMDSLVTEAEEMAAQGVKEINLIAQDITCYGDDLDTSSCLESLLERIVAIKGIQWVRLLYCHPHGITDRLLEIMDAEEVVCPYLDLPLQHVNREILKNMGRGPDSESPLALIERIRARKRRISLRTTLMVGFPGETERMFEELCDFVETVRFDHLGVFVFSPEKGTRAARFRTTVSGEVSARRKAALLTLQARISEDLNRRIVGRTVPVLVEGVCPETDLLLTGRTAAMAPDVDGRVLINKGTGQVGEIMPVRITESHAYDIIGEILSQRENSREGFSRDTSVSPVGKGD